MPLTRQTTIKTSCRLHHACFRFLSNTSLDQFERLREELEQSSPSLFPFRQRQAGTFSSGCATSDYLWVRLADITRMIASPDWPMFSVPTTTASPSRMLMSVLSPVLS